MTSTDIKRLFFDAITFRGPNMLRPILIEDVLECRSHPAQSRKDIDA
jgi:hypothetical protein